MIRLKEMRGIRSLGSGPMAPTPMRGKRVPMSLQLRPTMSDLLTEHIGISFRNARGLPLTLRACQ